MPELDVQRACACAAGVHPGRGGKEASWGTSEPCCTFWKAFHCVRAVAVQGRCGKEESRVRRMRNVTLSPHRCTAPNDLTTGAVAAATAGAGMTAGPGGGWREAAAAAWTLNSPRRSSWSSNGSSGSWMPR